jgi:hypothetical protein
MKQLEIEVRAIRIINIFLSILLIINGVLWFVNHLGSLIYFNLIYSVVTITAGIVFLFWRIGTDKIIIRANGESVYIKWVGRIRGTEVGFSEISSIQISQPEVIILRNRMKSLSYNLDNLDLSQKSEVFEYFHRIATDNGILFERHT